jgi:hypothetical protein
MSGSTAKGDAFAKSRPKQGSSVQVLGGVGARSGDHTSAKRPLITEMTPASTTRITLKRARPWVHTTVDYSRTVGEAVGGVRNARSRDPRPCPV